MLAHYEFRENSWVRSSNMLEAALKDGQKASLPILGKIVKKIWQGKVRKEYLEGRTQASFRHLGERLVVNDDVITDLSEGIMRKIRALCVAHEGWFMEPCNNDQNTTRLLKFYQRKETTRQLWTADAWVSRFSLNFLQSLSLP